MAKKKTAETDDAELDAETAAVETAAETLEPQSEPEEEAGPEDVDPDDPEELIASLLAENAELKDRLMRALAEAENVRRRADRDRRDAETYGGTKLARDILSVHDNLDRALGAADDAVREQAAAFIEGVELTRRELLNAFAKHKIEALVPEAGEKFDPNRHQAMFEAPIPGTKPGTVIEVMQTGFVIADRLLRPALVGVAKAVPEPATAPAEDEPVPEEAVEEADSPDQSSEAAEQDQR